MSSLNNETCILIFHKIYSILFFVYGCSGFYCRPEYYGHTVGYPSVYSSAVVGDCHRTAVFHSDLIICFRPQHICYIKTCPKLNAFYGTDRKYGHSENSVQLVKYGLATDGEKRTLEQWLEGGEERRRIYDRILSGESWKEYAALREDFDRATDYGQLQSDILQSIRLRNRRRSLRRAIVWGSSVAAVLLVGVLVVARFAHEAKPVVPQQLAQAGQEQLSSENVVLVLSDGEQISISSIVGDSLQVDGNATIRGTEKALVYQSDKSGLSGSEEEAAPEMNKVLIGTGGFYSLVLSDGTRVWLNAESELEYPVAFSSEKREVRLSGEAFFEVARDEARPFYVMVGEVQTRVLGTSFNIKAYDDDTDIVTTLFTGKVEVSPLKDVAKKVVLAPGEQADWNLRAGEMQTAKVDLSQVGAWREGMFLHFDYDLEDGEHYTFNGYFNRNDSLKTLLEEFAYISALDFRMANDTVYVTPKIKK